MQAHLYGGYVQPVITQGIQQYYDAYGNIQYYQQQYYPQQAYAYPQQVYEQQAYEQQVYEQQVYEQQVYEQAPQQPEPEPEIDWREGTVVAWLNTDRKLTTSQFSGESSIPSAKRYRPSIHISKPTFESLVSSLRRRKSKRTIWTSAHLSSNEAQHSVRYRLDLGMNIKKLSMRPRFKIISLND
jgi:hypothetical protein